MPRRGQPLGTVTTEGLPALPLPHRPIRRSSVQLLHHQGGGVYKGCPREGLGNWGKSCICEKIKEPIRVFPALIQEWSGSAGQWDAKSLIRLGNLLWYDVLTGNWKSKSKILPCYHRRNAGAKTPPSVRLKQWPSKPVPRPHTHCLFWFPNILLE